jgi:uncharacterized Fe-S cluster-containing radical SAM superfamily protein
MVDPTNIKNNNLVIQGVTEDKITLLVDGTTQEFDIRLDVLRALLEKVVPEFKAVIASLEKDCFL